MSKRLLILGAGRGQIGLYKAAKEMGVTTIAGTMPTGQLPCLALASEVCHMNIANPDDVIEKATKLNLDGVATCCLDTGVPALGKVVDKLGLIGLTEQAAILCGDKLQMKRAFMEHNVSTAIFCEVSSEKELQDAFNKLRFPIVVKATDLQGSNGVYICKDKETAVNSFREVMQKTHRKYCVVEEFLEGLEFGAQAFVHNHEVLFVMPHGDETYMCHTAVPVGHYVPFECTENVYVQIEHAVKSAIAALGLNDCAVNVDLILRENTVYVIELTGRVGANCLPELVQINFGIEYYKMIVAMAVGEDPLVYWNKRRKKTMAGMAKMILEIERNGILKNIEYQDSSDPDVLQVMFFKHPGDEIRMFENSNDCIGQIIVQGETIDKCRKKIDDTISHIQMDL